MAPFRLKPNIAPLRRTGASQGTPVPIVRRAPAAVAASVAGDVADVEAQVVRARRDDR